jgi:hypothetical protein
MKAILRNLLFLIASCVAIFNVHAYILFEDNFNYTNGPIDVVSGSSPITAGGGVWVSGPGSLYGVSNDIVASGANTVIIEGTANADLPRTYFTNGIPGIFMTNVPLFTNSVYYFVSNAPVAALYASFSLTVPSSSFGSGTNIAGSTYIAYFTTTNFIFAPRIYITTNTAASGLYRVGINNNGNPIPNSLTNIIAEDLTPDLTYTIVVRVALSTGRSTMWINPTVETGGVSTNSMGTDGLNGGGPANLPGIVVSDVTGTNTTVNNAICGFGLRNSVGGGPLFIGNLLIGTAFEDVVPSSTGSNGAFVAVPPANTTNFVGNTMTLSAVAGGDPDTMAFQWSVGGVPLTDGVNGDGSVTSGSQTSTLTISNVGIAETASYKVTVTNAANPGGASASANLVAISATTTPSFVTQPANTTLTLGGTATFTASATDGGPPVYYQWFHGGPIAGQTNATLALASVAFTQSGAYSVMASNQFGVVTSTNATLTVNQPASVSIGYLRSTLDNTNFAANSGATNYTVTGVVTTRANLTTANSVEFYMQDGTAGIAVFWGGAPGAPGSTNIPAQGTIATVTGPLGSFSGLLEIEPSFGSPFNSVTFHGATNVPAPQPLPFDPNIVNNPTNMQKHLVGSYFVASNVFLDLSSGPTFGGNANDPATNLDLVAQPFNLALYNPTNTTKGTNYTVAATNQNGETFVLFYNSHIDLIGAKKPTGPVTVYGVLGIFTGLPATSGYEFTPSGLADIVPAVLFTNILSNPVRLGDALTNTFTDNTIQPGETITINVVVIDPGGGIVTLGTAGDLPGNWNITASGGLTATASFNFTASTNNSGTLFVPSLTAAYGSSGVTSTNSWNVFVPTNNEQQVYLTEVFAAPTTNTTSPAFNPLRRAADTNNPAVNDQYVEFVNLSSSTVFLENWTLVDGNGNVRHTFLHGEALAPSNSVVIYGGPATLDPSAPTLSALGLEFLEAADQGGSPSLSLNPKGGVIGLYDNGGHLVDRLAYPASDTNNPSAFSRFPVLNSGLVPQAYISTNYVTPGSQYDGGSWLSATKVPTGVTGVDLIYGNPLALGFTANTTNATTLWGGGSVLTPFQVITGQLFTNTSGLFLVTNPPSGKQFYFITTQ